MKDILSEIVAHKRLEIEQEKRLHPSDELREAIQRQEATESVCTRQPRRSMKASLATSPTGIIAEFKRRSPSKGWIFPSARPEEVIPTYEAAGAAALSILTDEAYFGGTLDDIRAVRRLVSLPILRKDFTIDSYQLLQARLVGADAVLLIAACLTQTQCNELAAQAHELGLEVLLEVHSTDELAYINKGVDMVGVNNRNLGTFVTDVRNSFRIAEELQEAVTRSGMEQPVLVSESGLSRPETIRELRATGFRGFLMGEAFMKTPQPGETLKVLAQAINP